MFSRFLSRIVARGLITACAVVFATFARIQAQILEPDTLNVPVDVSAYLSALGNVTAHDNVFYTGTHVPLLFTPGGAYSVAVSISSGNTAALQYSPPPGYRVFINDIERTRINLPTGTSVISVRFESDRGGSFGAVSSFRAGPSHTILAFGMGHLSNGRSAGVMTLTEPTATNHTYTTGSLRYSYSSPDIDTGWVASTGTSQYYVYNGLVALTPVSSASFRVGFYPRAQVGIKIDGGYAVSGDPIYEYVIANTGYPTHHNTVQVTRTIRQGGATHISWTQTDKLSGGAQYQVSDWYDAASPARVKKDWSSATYSSTWYSDSSTTSSYGTPTVLAHQERRDYKMQSDNNWELTARMLGSGSTAITTDYTYANQRLVTETSTGGLWRKHEYYTDFDRYGQLYRTYQPDMNSPADASQASTTSGQLTTYDYEADWTGRKVLPKSIITTVNGTTSARAEFTYDQDTTVTDVSRNYSGSNATLKLLVATRKDYYDATHYLTTVTTTYRGDADSQFRYFPGLPRSEKRPDGTMTMHLYFRGTFDKVARDFSAAKDGPEILKLSFIGTTATSTDTATMASYVMGDQTAATDTGFRMVPGASTAQGTVLAADGTVICTLAYICTGTTSSPAWRVVQRDVHSYADGVLHSFTMRDAGDSAVTWPVLNNIWSKGRMDATVDEQGVRTDFTYDVAGRVQTKSRKSAAGADTIIGDLTTTLEYDAANHVNREIVSGVSTTETLTTLRSFDTAGRLLSETTPGYATAGSSTASAVTTSRAYDPVNRKITTTLPSGATRIETGYQDGRPASVTGTGVVAEYFTYGIETDGRRKTTLNLGTSTNARKKESWVDLLGRKAKTTGPGFTGQPDFEETNVFDDYTGGNSGRLLKTTKSGLAPTLYDYNAMAQVVRSGLDLDASGTLAPTSSDRVGDTVTMFESYDGAWWKTTTASNYPFTGGSAGTAKTVSIARQRLTGLTASLRGETRTFDTYGNETRATVNVDFLTKLATTTTRRPGMAVDAVEKKLNGLLVETSGHDGLVRKKRYDQLNRLRAEIEPRTGTESAPSVQTTYHPNTTWPKEVKDATNRRLAFTHYDAAGRVIYTEDAYLKTTRTSYTARGEVEYVWGTAATPVSYAYSQFGERTTLRTYRQSSYFAADSTSWPGASATADETTWEFDGPSGLLKKKIDAAAKYVEYTYNARGQTATRAWARTLPFTSTRVTTTYAYFGDGSGEPLTGELKSTSYNDGTPGVSNTYTRLGQKDSITDAAGTRDFVYDSTYPDRMAAEALDSFFGSRVLTHTYDSTTSTNTGVGYGAHTLGSVAGRPRGLQVGTTGTPADDLEFIYDVSNAGRFAGINSRRGNGTASRKFLYGYETNSDLLKTLAIDGSHPFTITRTFESGRDLVTEIEAKWSTTSRTKYAYAYDDLRRRQSVVQSGDVFADYGDSIHQICEYTDRSELKTAATFLGASPTDQTSPLSGRRHEFGYDAIGNRKTSNTSGLAAIADEYSANALNQYTARENNTLPVGGIADTGARVVAGAYATTRAGRAGKHWGDNTLVPNASAPYLGPLTIYALKPGGSNDLLRTETKTAFAPPAYQTFTYDDDGNILNDGVWTYEWDAENRLVVIATATAAIGPIPSVDARRIEFKYDHQHRRIEKLVRGGWSGSAYTTIVSHRRFLYDGWSMLEEFAVSGTSLTLARSYTWGLDIARSLTDAGGVGGLLQIRDYATSKDYLPSYDGNGNVVALFDAAAASSAIACVAAYEYSPFGAFLRCEGDYAKANPFTFSTKFTDDESELVYYGRRYYSPSQGRFLGRDPKKEKGGLHLYAFVTNNPINLWDYLGMIPPSITGPGASPTPGAIPVDPGSGSSSTTVTGGFIFAGPATETRGAINATVEGLVVWSVDRGAAGYTSTSGAIGAVGISTLGGAATISGGVEWTINSVTHKTDATAIVFVGTKWAGIWQTKDGWGYYGAFSTDYLTIGGGLTMGGTSPIQSVYNTFADTLTSVGVPTSITAPNPGDVTALPTVTVSPKTAGETITNGDGTAVEGGGGAAPPKKKEDEDEDEQAGT